MATRRLLRLAYMTAGRVMFGDNWIRKQRLIRPGSDGSANENERGSFETRANRLYQSRANVSAGRPTFQFFGQASDLKDPHRLSLFERYQSSVQKGHRYLDCADSTILLFSRSRKLLGQLGMGFFFCWLLWDVCQEPELTLEAVWKTIGLLMGDLPDDARNMIGSKIWFVIKQLRKNQSPGDLQEPADMENALAKTEAKSDCPNKPDAFAKDGGTGSSYGCVP